MTYVVTVGVSTPEGASDLDALQREGVVHLLKSGLESIEAIEGPDGMEVGIEEHVIAVHPGGALLKVFADAPALEFAEDAVHGVISEVLELSELLADWEIAKCEVELQPDSAQESLDAADGPDAPPADPAERARLHALSRPAGEPGRDATDVETMRLKLRSLAPRLAAFPLACFGYTDNEAVRIVNRETAEVAAGALVYVSEILVDELFADLATLEEDGPNVGESDGVFMILDDLPQQFAAQYTVLFSRRLAVAAVMLTGRFHQPGFGELSCLAEELLTRILLNQAEVTADLYGLLDDDVSRAWQVFADHVYEDSDHEWLYDPTLDDLDDLDDEDDAAGPDDPAGNDGTAEADGTDEAADPARTTDVNDWFTPFTQDSFVHPYAAFEAGDTEESSPQAG
ncbi:hypothetical protein POF50_018230 [Streptomyces sp. SL13]|uniref:Uncharacterized protein n=1 Tax=Streptantibioticus silvisoli TaxID=2705255 RepID=A0AA90H5C2_9ACTN|nr:hypothetical protein [Streptantibioticus silvisoli]MDI5971258.1 hypothetical protein [Streptantibioticus silvisoli]